MPFVIHPFYFWTGWVSGLALTVLCLMSILLLCLGWSKEKSSRITLIPCLVCAICATIIVFAYGMELYVAYSSGAKYEMEAFKLRITGPYWYVFILSVICVTAPILFFIPKFRNSLKSVLTISLIGISAYWLDNIIVWIHQFSSF